MQRTVAKKRPYVRKTKPISIVAGPNVTLRKTDANKWVQVSPQETVRSETLRLREFIRSNNAAEPGHFSHAAWDKLLEDTVLKIKSLAVSKGAEYAHGDDRLDNFRRNGADVGLPMEVIWRVYAGKHWDSITTYIKDLSTRTERHRSEPISGRVDDLLVYLVLLKAMLIERGEA